MHVIFNYEDTVHTNYSTQEYAAIPTQDSLATSLRYSDVKPI